jgi:hypothetical protein
LFHHVISFILYDSIYLKLEPFLTIDFRTNRLIFEQKLSLTITKFNLKLKQNQKMQIKLDKVPFGRLV